LSKNFHRAYYLLLFFSSFFGNSLCTNWIHDYFRK
jgi:hypothetical protein